MDSRDVAGGGEEEGDRVIPGLEGDPSKVDGGVFDSAAADGMVRFHRVDTPVAPDLDLEGLIHRATQAQADVVVAFLKNREVVGHLARILGGVDEVAPLGDTGAALVGGTHKVSLVFPGQCAEDLLGVRDVRDALFKVEAPHHHAGPLRMGHWRPAGVAIKRNQRHHGQGRDEPEGLILLEG